MTCKPDSTHHHACACREAKFWRMEEVLEKISKFGDGIQAEWIDWENIGRTSKDLARNALEEA